jgi:hypothetical protein
MPITPFLNGTRVGQRIAAEAALEECRALVDRINTGLSGKPFVRRSSLAELEVLLELADSILRKKTR